MSARVKQQHFLNKTKLLIDSIRSIYIFADTRLLPSSMRFARQLIVTGVRSFSQKAGAPSSSAGQHAAAAPQDPLANVKGLSADCLQASNQPVGPGAAANAPYKVPEYFLYNTMSYHHAEVEMQKYRIPQPNANRQ